MLSKIQQRFQNLTFQQAYTIVLKYFNGKFVRNVFHPLRSIIMVITDYWGVNTLTGHGRVQCKDSKMSWMPSPRVSSFYQSLFSIVQTYTISHTASFTSTLSLITWNQLSNVPCPWFKKCTWIWCIRKRECNSRSISHTSRYRFNPLDCNNTLSRGRMYWKTISSKHEL